LARGFDRIHQLRQVARSAPSSSTCVIGSGLRNISNRCRARRKIRLSSVFPRLSAPKLQACFKGIEFQSKRRQRQSKTIQFFRTWVAPVHPFPVNWLS
jgi:hypothetical protein